MSTPFTRFDIIEQGATMPDEESPVPGERPVTVTVDQLKVLSEPSRLRMLTLLMERDMSISGIAKALDLTPATVHHHINQLLAAKLIQPTRSEIRGNLVEKYY